MDFFTSGNTQDREESVEEFVRRNLGDEVFERLIEPFCSGTFQTSSTGVKSSM